MNEETEVETLELEIVLRGPRRPTSNRDTLAQLKVPIEGGRGWMIYREAMRLAVAGEAGIVFTGADADNIRV